VCADFAEYMQNLRHSGTEDFNEDVARWVFSAVSSSFAEPDLAVLICRYRIHSCLKNPFVQIFVKTFQL
jgi:hypothetical protein